MNHKSTLLVIVVGLHLLGFYWLDKATRYTPSKHTDDSALLVEFKLREIQPAQPVQRVSTVKDKAKKTSSATHSQKKTRIALNAPNDAVAVPTLTLINKDGSIILPQQTRDAFLDDIENRTFAVQHKGLDDMQKLLHRPVALPYQASVFEKDWQGDKSRLDRALEKAVDKTTLKIKIPIPGRPGAYLRCGIAILAMGGSCGFTANDDGYFVRDDDPNTLSPEEDRQCNAWWDLIVSAKTQAVWRKTKKLYQQECEKPLAK